MASKPLPPQGVLRQLLSYNPDTGKLFWKERDLQWFTSPRIHRGWNTQFAGKEAFTAITDTGYYHSCIIGVRCYAHRVIWRLVTGEIPDQIDHINGVRTDNRLCNLRNVSHSQNGKNLRARTSNTSGHMGVHWFPRDGTWRARIRVDGRDKHLGYFAAYEDAVAARKAAEVDHGFHPMHGR